MTKNKLIFATIQALAAATQVKSGDHCGEMMVRFGDRLVELSRIEEELNNDTIACFLTPEGQDCLTVETLLEEVCLGDGEYECTEEMKEEIYDEYYDRVRFYYKPAIEARLDVWDEACGREKGEVLYKYTERFGFMAHLAFNGREEFLEMTTEQLECPTCLNRSETESDENDEYDEDKGEEEHHEEEEEHHDWRDPEDYHPLKNLMYAFHVNVENAESCFDGSDDPWCVYQREKGLENLRIVLNQFVGSCGAMAGSACHEVGLEPALVSEEDEFADYVYLRKVSHAFYSMINNTLFCYVPGPVQETKWCQFFLFEDGKEFLEMNLNNIAKKSECPLCETHGIEPTWPGYH